MSYFKVSRGWQDSPVFDGAPYSEREAWLWMVGEAQWKDGTRNILGKPVFLRRGQFSHSVRFMADKFKWSTNRVLRFLKKLKTWQMSETHSETGQLIITICNYSKYQDGGDTPGDTNGDTGGDTPGDKEEEGQEGKEKKVVGPPEAAPEKTPAKNQKKGKRLAAEIPDLAIPQEWGQWAYDELRLTEAEINFEWEKFRDYWAGVGGSKGCKLDWPATWRNWCRKKFEDKKRKEELNGLYRKK